MMSPASQLFRHSAHAFITFTVLASGPRPPDRLRQSPGTPNPDRVTCVRERVAAPINELHAPGDTCLTSC